MLRKCSLISLFLIIFTGKGIFAQYEISGVITDSIQGSPIENARAELYGLNKYSYSDKQGRFTISIPDSGLYTITVSAGNYQSYITTLILTLNSPNKKLEVRLSLFAPHTDTIDVNAKYYKKADDISTSYINTQYEEIRKNPGSFEDVVKYFTTAPGVNTANDSYNQILVRGGAPTENLILIDGFEIPNLNHYGPPGTSNGALSFISSKLICEVDFFSGGFPARYGDKLSSVMDIKYREGNSSKHIRDINISATGFGGFFEGPLNRKSSYMFSARKSYIALFKEQLGTDLLPDFWDFNLKLNYNLSKTEKLSFNSLYVIDHAEAYKLNSNFPNDTVNSNITNMSLKYTKVLPEFEYSSVTGYSNTYYDVKYILYKLNITDRYISNSQNFGFKLSKLFKADVNAGFRYFFSEYDVFHESNLNESNYFVPELSVKTDLNTLKVFAGVNFTTSLFGGKLILNTGARLDYFQYMNHGLAVSPRLGALFKISENTNLTANAGIYFQAPEAGWLVIYTANRDLKYIRADEVIIGAEHFIGSNIKISAETYLKQYHNYPVSLYNPNYVFINNGVALYPNFLDEAVSAGKGYYMGFDLTVQQKNNGNGLYWTFSYSYSHSKFLALVGNYQPVEFDPGNQINVTAGYKFNDGFSLSSHFKYAGGLPYTPYDIELSKEHGRGIFIQDYYNKARLPEYVRWDIRAEQLIHPWGSELTLYLEVLNVLDRLNVDHYSWNYYINEQYTIPHFFRLPIFGVSWKF